MKKRALDDIEIGHEVEMKGSGIIRALMDWP